MDRSRKQKQARNVFESVSSQAMKNLPSHILMDIFLRLPIKAVMTIRCVSKSLLNLVSEPYFKELYSTRAPTELLIRKWNPKNLPLSTVYIADPLFHDDSSSAVDLKVSVVFDLPSFSVIPGDDPNVGLGATVSKLTLVNSCNGLVCYCGSYGNRFVIICNPFTGECVTIPDRHVNDNSIDIKDTLYGFGFSPKGDRFKLLRLLCLRNVGANFMVGEIYTFGESRSWKSVANCPDFVYRAGKPTFYEGVAHWYWDSLGNIVTFDFDTEQFGEIKSPPFRSMGRNVGGLSRLCVLGDCLHITGCTEYYFEVWVMKERGAQSFWSKAFSMSREWYEPVKYLRNGKIIMLNDVHKIVHYEPDTKYVKRIDSCLSTCEAISIKPSLVPLKVMLGDNVNIWNARPGRAHNNHIEVAIRFFSEQVQNSKEESLREE